MSEWSRGRVQLSVSHGFSIRWNFLSYQSPRRIIDAQHKAKTNIVFAHGEIHGVSGVGRSTPMPIRYWLLSSHTHSPICRNRCLHSRRRRHQSHSPCLFRRRWHYSTLLDTVHHSNTFSISGQCDRRSNFSTTSLLFSRRFSQ